MTTPAAPFDPAAIPGGLPFVTIAIPTFNRVHFLEQAIKSALAQQYPNIEVVVSDNTSTDGTGELLAGWQDAKLRTVRQPNNVGMLGNWNTCLALARGEYVLMLSDDDRLAPTAISDLILPFLSRESQAGGPPSDDVAFSYGYCEIHDTTKNIKTRSCSAPLRETSEDYRVGYLRCRRVNYPSATLARVRDAKDAGGYRRSGKCPIDIELAFRVSAMRPMVACTQTITTFYTFHPSNFTSSVPAFELLQSTRGLTEIAEQMAEKSGAASVRRVQNAGRWGEAFAHSHAVNTAFSDGSIGFFTAMNQLWDARKVFANPAGLELLLKTVLKVFLCCVVGRKRNRIGSSHES